jgi:hypothetical protein
VLALSSLNVTLQHKDTLSNGTDCRKGNGPSDSPEQLCEVSAKRSHSACTMSTSHIMVRSLSNGYPRRYFGGEVGVNELPSISIPPQGGLEWGGEELTRETETTVGTPI